MEMYTIGSDKVGTRTVETLTEIRKAGSDVVIISDALGTRKDTVFSKLKHAGGGTSLVPCCALSNACVQ